MFLVTDASCVEPDTTAQDSNAPTANEDVENTRDVKSAKKKNGSRNSTHFYISSNCNMHITTNFCQQNIISHFSFCTVFSSVYKF